MAIFVGFRNTLRMLFVVFIVGISIQFFYVDWNLGQNVLQCKGKNGLPCHSNDEQFRTETLKPPSTIELTTQSQAVTKTQLETPTLTKRTTTVNTLLENTDITTSTKDVLKKEKFLVIGIPSVKRENASYLASTLKSLVYGLDDKDKKEISIVVFLADIEPANSSMKRTLIQMDFSESDELIKYIDAPSSYYPKDFHKLDALWGHTKERAAWLNKQALDYVFLWKHCMNLKSRYYLHLEDDVQARKGYLKNIRKFIKKYENASWSSLQFGEKGTVGFLYRTTDLNKLQTFTRIFSWFYPVDFLIRHFNELHLHGNQEWSKHKPSLFSHVGEVSSFQGEIFTKLPTKHSRWLLVNHTFASAQFPKAEVIVPMRGIPNKDAFLIIGIPTIKRKKGSYLDETLRGLITGLDHSDIKNVLLVIFLSDLEPEKTSNITKDVMEKFPEEIQSGLIKMVKAPASYYENTTLEGLPALWKDKPDRVKWRARQCLDYAFLFNYIHHNYPDKYYLHIEDDIYSKPGYFPKIKNFIKFHENHKWSILEFAKSLGFIAFLYRTSDLGRLACFIKTYYWTLPVDMLARHYHEFHLYGNQPWAVHVPPLFEHFGMYSSLEGVTRKPNLNSKFVLRKFSTCDNPTASITTSIQPAMQQNFRDIASTYALHFGKYNYFWGRDVTVGDFILIQFTKLQNVSKVMVNSGGRLSELDYFGGANISRSVQQDCGDLVAWKSFHDEKHLIASEENGMGCYCIKIEISAFRTDDKNKTRWLLIESIGIWTLPKTVKLKKQ